MNLKLNLDHNMNLNVGSAQYSTSEKLQLFLANISMILSKCITCEIELRERVKRVKVIMGLDLAAEAGVGKACAILQIIICQ